MMTVLILTLLPKSVDTATDDGVAVTGNVLDNDNDVDTGDTLVVTNAGSFNGTYGTLTLNGDGSYSYSVTDETLADGEAVSDVFTVNVFDGDATVSTTLTFNITGSNDAPVAVDVTGSVNEDDSASIPNGQFEYLAAGETTTDTFTYTVDDGNGGTSTATATITITGQNDAPVAAAVVATVMEDGPAVTIAADFTDVDVLDTHTFTVDTTGTVGNVTNNNNGTFSYDPNGAFETLGVGETATTSFTYTVTDNNGLSSTETVTITITGQNDAPTVAAGVRVDATEDDAIQTVNLLDGATDVDVNAMQVVTH